MTTDPIFEFIESKEDRFLEELFELLRIPSISTDDEHAEQVQQAAHWLAAHLESIGIADVAVHPTDGHPIVYARHCHAGDDAPTLLIYGHYDVQPPDPLDEWKSPPFEPQVRDGKIFARGATDDKGQFFAHVKGLEAWLATAGELPVNVKILLEGEEEIGSKHLGDWVRDHSDELACDAVIISDSSMFAPGIPSITYSLRGLAYLEMTVHGPSHDLHSGLYGGAVPNPINELTRIIAQLHDDDGRVTIPGFYDDVRELQPDERQAIAELPFDEQDFIDETGVAELKGEDGYSTLERIWARPTLDCNGIWGGFTGDGAKTVLPATAHAKFSCRLVADQDPDDIAQRAQQWVEELADDAVRVETRMFHGGQPVLMDRDGPQVQAACRALEQVWDHEVVFTRGGGTIPVVSVFSQLLDVPTVLIGFGLEDDRLHSPNEKFNLENFYAGIRTSARLWEQLAR